MSSLFKNYKTDETKEKDGVRIELAPNDDGTTPVFIVGRSAASNPRYMKSLERFTRPYRRQIDNETLPPALAEKIRREIFIDSILLGWEHVQDEAGKEIPYTAENADKLFQALPELFNELETTSKKSAMFLAEVKEKEAKN